MWNRAYSFPLHFDTVDMQRCMVAIELNARRLLDERRATRDDPLAHQRETGTSYSHRKKRPSGVGSKTEWKTPETTHAVQHLVFSQDGARVRCSRCTRVASKSHSGQWRAFWMAECVEVREDQNLRQVEGSRSYWSGAGAEAMRDLVKLLAEEHEVAVEDLLFSGNVQAPINCRVCRKPGLFWLLAAIITRKSCVLSHVLAHSWQPIGCGNVFSILLLSRHRVLGKISPAENLLICNHCGLYTVDVPHSFWRVWSRVSLRVVERRLLS